MLGIQLQKLGDARGFLVSWVGTIAVVLLSYHAGTRLVGAEPQFMMLMAGGASICGSSAATGINESFGRSLPPSAVTAVIAILTIFTVPQVFALPLFARAIGLETRLAGAWVGSTIDSTSFVVAAAALLDSDESELGVDTAATIKIIQNVLIAPVCVVVSACFPAWPAGDAATIHERNPLFAGPDLSESSTDNADRPPLGARVKATLALLWDRLPKFTIGFILASAVLSIMSEFSRERSHQALLVIQSFSRLFFAIGFFHVGLATNFFDLYHKLGSMAGG